MEYNVISKSKLLDVFEVFANKSASFEKIKLFQRGKKEGLNFFFKTYILR